VQSTSPANGRATSSAEPKAEKDKPSKSSSSDAKSKNKDKDKHKKSKHSSQSQVQQQLLVVEDRSCVRRLSPLLSLPLSLLALSNGLSLLFTL
jgi:hypothetical protein